MDRGRGRRECETEEYEHNCEKTSLGVGLCVSVLAVALVGQEEAGNLSLHASAMQVLAIEIS